MTPLSTSRRHFLKAMSAVTLTSTFGIITTRAEAAEFTLKYANYQPLSHPNNVYATKMAARIAEDSKGRVELQIYPNSQLGSDTDMLSQLRSGALDFLSLGPITLATLIPTALLSGLGFAFKSYDKVWEAMDGDLGAMVRRQLAEKTSIFAFEKVWDNGYRQITSSNRQINTPEDLKGIKMRVPPAPVLTSLFRALNSSPTTISMHDVYLSLQTKVIDAQENPLVLISASKLYEVQKYCAMTNHIWDGFWVLGNKASFAKLPSDLQEIVTRNVNAAGVEQRALTMQLNTSLVDDLKAKGLMFNNPDIAAFRAKLSKSGFYSEWRKRLGEEAWATLEKYSGSIA